MMQSKPRRGGDQVTQSVFARVVIASPFVARGERFAAAGGHVAAAHWRDPRRPTHRTPVRIPPFPAPLLPMITLGLMPLLLASALPSQQPPAVVRLVARNYSIEGPAGVAAGLVAVRLVNRGQEPHYARLLKLAPGKSLADFAALRQQGGRGAEWLVPAGGVAPVSPGDSAELALRLDAGRYVILCGYPGRDGRPHVDHGMMTELVVGPATSDATPPSHDLELGLGDGSMTWSAPPSGGRHTILVTNTGTQTHQALLSRLPDGRTLADEKAWFADFRSERPGAPAGGVIELRPGERVWLTIDLPPGRYALLCHVSNPAVGTHFDQNEATEMIVR